MFHTSATPIAYLVLHILICLIKTNVITQCGACNCDKHGNNPEGYIVCKKDEVDFCSHVRTIHSMYHSVRRRRLGYVLSTSTLASLRML